MVDYDFVDAMELDLLEGRSFDPDHYYDAMRSVLINESAAEFLGFKNPVNKFLYQVNGYKAESIKYRIIGVVKDFHFQGFTEPIKPVVIQYNPEIWFILMRVSKRNFSATLNTLEKKREVYEPSHPFRYTFLEQDYAELYEADQRFGMVFLSFAVLTLLIACLGLFGLSSFTAEQKTKEIGIRKVMGASGRSLVLDLSKEFGRLILISIVLSWPLAWFIMDYYWLDSYAFRIDLTSVHFIIASFVASLIALGTESLQAVRAALEDSIRSLRYE